MRSRCARQLSPTQGRTHCTDRRWTSRQTGTLSGSERGGWPCRKFQQLRHRGSQRIMAETFDGDHGRPSLCRYTQNTNTKLNEVARILVRSEPCPNTDGGPRPQTEDPGIGKRFMSGPEDRWYPARSWVWWRRSSLTQGMSVTSNTAPEHARERRGQEHVQEADQHPPSFGRRVNAWTARRLRGLRLPGSDRRREGVRDRRGGGRERTRTRPGRRTSPASCPRRESRR